MPRAFLVSPVNLLAASVHDIAPCVEGGEQEASGKREEGPVGEPDEDLLFVGAGTAAVDGHGQGVYAGHGHPHAVWYG